MSVQVKGSGTIGGLDEGLVVSGIVTSSTQINVGSNIKLGNAGVITATSFVGNITGTATQVSLAAQSSDTDCYPVFSLTATGNQALFTKSNRLFFNSSTGALSVTSLNAISKIGINQSAPFAELDITSSVEDSNGSLSQHGIRLAHVGAADEEVIPISAGFVTQQNRARAAIGFISKTISGAAGMGGAIGFYTRNTADGNALYITDEKVRIDSSGRVIIGHNASIGRHEVGDAALQVSGTGPADSGIVVGRWSADNAPANLELSKSRNATIGSNTAVQANDVLGHINFSGNDGTRYLGAAFIKGIATNPIADYDCAGYLTFGTNYGTTSPTERLRIASDGTVTVGDGNNLAANYDATMLIDGGDNTKFSVYGGTTGTGTVAFPDGSGSSAAKMAGFIQMNHTSNDNGPRLNMGLNNTTMVHLRAPGSNRGQLEIYGSFNESTTPAIEINHGNDARKVFLTNSAGDFNAITRNGSQTKGQLKMFESGVLLHNMKNPDATSTLQTFRAGVYKLTTGSTYTSISPITHYITKGGSGTYDCFEEGNCELVVNGGGNDHYQPIGFVPRGYNLDQTSFGGQWAGEMWIHQTGSQNPTSFGYSGYNTWATMSFKCRWDSAHWNAKPNGFWVEHYINQGRAQIAKIDASSTQSQFVIYLLPGQYKIRFNCVRGMSVHRAVSDGAALVMRDGGSFVTYNTLAYSSRNTSFDSEISPGSANQAYTT